MKLLQKYKKDYEKQTTDEMTLEEYLTLCKKDESAYATPAERILKAIGEPVLLDTAKAGPRMSRIFGNRIIKTYPIFSDFYGMETVIEQVVSHFKHAAQGLEESKQILYLLGPVGSAKSSLVERLKKVCESVPFYAIKGSPIHENPLGLLSTADAEELGIPERYLQVTPSPWALKKLEEFQGDLTKFTVEKLYPSQSKQIAIAKTEPGDENNQDISTLVGKLDIRKLEYLPQDDPEAYRYSGGLCLANRGMLDFVEMFKAPIKMLHPLLTATQEGNYNATEALPAIPFEGLVVAHSNEAEWDTFRENKNNEAFLDRMNIVEVPYNLKITEEIDINKKLISNSALKNAPCAPNTLEILSKFAVLTRLEVPANSDIQYKMDVYDGKNIKNECPKAKSLQEYKDAASPKEGFFGFSTRASFKVLSKVYNFDAQEIAANPVHMIYIIEKTIDQLHLDSAKEELYMAFLKHLAEEYAKELGEEIQTAYIESYDEYGQNIFDRYVVYADHWIQDNDYRDPDTGEMYEADTLNQELEKFEKPAGIANPKDFRHEVVNYCLRYQARHEGNNPSWTAYEKLRKVIQASMFSKTEDLLPVISFSAKGSKDDQKKHDQFIDRMVEKGYTRKQVQLLVEWHQRFIKNN